MITKRIIPCLDVKDGRVVKGVQFQGLNDVASPVELARYYSAHEADELVFYDITASAEGRGIFLDVVERVAREIFIPFSVGGGISSVEDMRAVLLAGADGYKPGTPAYADSLLHAHTGRGAAFNTAMAGAIKACGLDVTFITPSEYAK